MPNHPDGLRSAHHTVADGLRTRTYTDLHGPTRTYTDPHGPTRTHTDPHGHRGLPWFWRHYRVRVSPCRSVCVRATPPDRSLPSAVLAVNAALSLLNLACRLGSKPGRRHLRKSGCPAWIRTKTNWTKTSCATITPPGKWRETARRPGAGQDGTIIVFAPTARQANRIPAVIVLTFGFPEPNRVGFRAAAKTKDRRS